MTNNQALKLQERLLDGYDATYDGDGISGERMARRLGEISMIGATGDGGSNRPGFSTEEKRVKELVKGWMQEAGLQVREDGAGNVFGRIDGKNNEQPAIVSGSHVDSVPNGGHFDGVLGVVSALEVAEAWKEMGYQPDKPFEVAIFSDEEGARFNGGFNGSDGLVGGVPLEEKRALTDFDGKSFAEVLEAYGSSVEAYENSLLAEDALGLFVELHIEQGKRLEQEDLPCGVVTGIAGPCWLEVTFTGEAGHAGNTPMGQRQDALVAASEFIWKAEDLPKEVSDSAVVTIGKMHVTPNGVNVIPGEVKLSVDIRDIYQASRDALVTKVIEMAKDVASKRNISFAYEENTRVDPVPIEETKQQLLEQSIEAKGIRPYRLPSGAGHDAMILGKKWPVAMLFVRSQNGISHNPAEWTALSDCVQSVGVLKHFIERL